jgi:protein AroM
MSQLTLGLLTLGQAPRVDRLGPEVAEVLGGTARIVERGALDDLSDHEIDALAPPACRDPLVTLLRDGRSTWLDMDAVVPLIEEKILQLENEDGVASTLLVCGGDFPPLSHRRPLIQPHDALYGFLQGLAGERALASMVPISEQTEPIKQAWARFRKSGVCMVVADPYARDAIDQVKVASQQARREGADFLYMECFGYTLAMRDVARQAFGRPVLLARSLAGRMLAELC